MLIIPHCLDNRLTDGGKVVRTMHPQHFTPQKHYYFYVPGTHFCLLVLNYFSITARRYMGKIRYNSNVLVLNLDTRWSSMVRFMLVQLTAWQKEPPIHIVQDTALTPEPAWTIWRRNKFHPCPRIDPPPLPRHQ
jgi:hypothetical protein